jgi:putative oxidoreductase
MNILDKLLTDQEEKTYALLRIVAGFLFLWHGSQKLFDFPLEFPYPLSPLIQAAAIIEIIGGALILLGLFTRPVAFLCSGTMAVAYWMAHGMRDLFPINNGGEISALYCFIFLFIACKGSGIWSINWFSTALEPNPASDEERSDE